MDQMQVHMDQLKKNHHHHAYHQKEEHLASKEGKTKSKDLVELSQTTELVS